MAKYTQRLDGEYWFITREEIFRIACCDCGLVHDIIVVEEEDGKLTMAARRNNRATGQRRRRRNELNEASN